MEIIFSTQPETIVDILKSAQSIQAKLSEAINDDIDSCEEFDDHILAPINSDALKTVQKIEQLIANMLIKDIDGQIRSKFEEITLIDALAGRETPLKRILARTK